jgi:hypothetical protein
VAPTNASTLPFILEISWVNGKDNNPEDAFLVTGRGEAMRERFGDIMQPIPIDLRKLSICD